MNNIRVLYLGDDSVLEGYLQQFNLELGWKTKTISPKNKFEEHLDPEIDLWLIDLDKVSLEKLPNSIRSSEKNICIFLTSSDKEDTYILTRESMPYAYLIKPLSYLQLRSIIELAFLSPPLQKKAGFIIQSWQEEKELQSSFFIKSNQKLLKVKQKDILSVVADGNYCVIVTPQRRHAVKISLRRIKLKLSPVLFKQIHRNFIIQLPRIESIDLSSNEVFIQGESYPIGGSFRQAFLDVLDRI